MVLKNSKWDKKAKHEYLKKHNLLKKNQGQSIANRPKWSSKTDSIAPSTVVLQDSDEEYDTEEDDELLRQFFPKIGEANLTKQQKQKIKLQILTDLENPHQEEDNGAEGQSSEQFADGIYLGSEQQRFQDLQTRLNKCTLDDYVTEEITTGAKTDTKNRKLLKNKELKGGLFEEYGITYADSVRKEHDYNHMACANYQNRKLDDIPNDDLVGFKVGQSTLGDNGLDEKRQLKVLEGDDLEQNNMRLQKANHERFLRQIKTRFSESTINKPTNVLEVNNFNNQDEIQIKNLNARLRNYDANTVPNMDVLDDDINSLLGETSSVKPTMTYEDITDLDNLINSFENNKSSNPTNKTYSPHPSSTSKPTFVSKPPDANQAFLDDLLG